MFASKFAKAHPKTAEGPNRKLVHKRSTLFGGTVERMQMLQRSIDHQAQGHIEQEADPAGLTASASTPGVFWDFGKIPVFPSDRTHHDTSAPQEQMATPAPPDQTSRDRTPDGSEPINLAPITFVRAPSHFSVEGGCDNLHLHGKTDAAFDGGVGHVENQVATPVKDCGCEKGVQCFRVTGTLVTDYSVSVTINMPPVPSGLTKCEQGKVQAWLDNVLTPHEEDHRKRFMTYNGQTRNPVNVTGCGEDDVKKKVQAITDAEEPPRQAKAKALSEAIDPFVRIIDCSDCDKAPPPGKQSTKTDAGSARTPDAGS